MPICVFPPHYQLVYINFDISSFSLISYRQKDSDDTEENKQKAKTKTQFSNTKMQVLQKNLIILHLLVDSMSYTSKFMLQILGLV